MYTTVAFYSGSIKEDHKYLQTYLFKDGYVVEEKGVSFLTLDEYSKCQEKRFSEDEALLRIDIMGITHKEKTLLKS